VEPARAGPAFAVWPRGLGEIMIERFVRHFFKHGALIVRLPGGVNVSLGGATEADAPVIVRLADAETCARIVRNAALAAGEAYMDGKLVIERGELYDFLALCSRNFLHNKKKDTALSRLRRRAELANARAAARANAAHHYDLSADFFRLFLDADQQYSCAYFAEPGMSLEAAQAAKKRHIAAKLVLEPGQSVLDIGSGWGGLGLTLAEAHGARVTGVTLSTEQLAVARERAAARGLADAARFELRDYRDVEGTFDRIVSVGMFEHVGAPNFQAYFETIARLLDDEGAALIHTIGRMDGPGATNPWIAKYIFPGGYLPALSEIAAAVERAGLMIADVEVLRVHYAETLRAWRARFMARRAEAAAMYDERFCRMWEFYLAASEASFRFGPSVVFQVQLVKNRNAVPLTRDYITDFDRADARAAERVAAE
jgi:cyclopropane-fatty-acyl-phospholipid synthase